MVPSEVGIGPVSRFSQRSKLIRLVRLPSIAGIGPIRLLPYNSRYWRFTSPPRSGRRGPEIPALPKSLRIKEQILKYNNVLRN